MNLPLSLGTWRKHAEIEKKALKATEEAGSHFGKGDDSSFSALDEDDLQIVIIENKLGCDIYLKKADHNSDSIQLLQDEQCASMLMPPRRFSDTLNVAAECRETRNYVAVQIFEAKGLPIVDDGNGHNFFCALRLVVDSHATDQQKLFPQSARTKCVKPFISSMNDLEKGTAKWNELFIFETPRESYFMWDSFLTGVASAIMRNLHKNGGENEFAVMEYLNITVVTSNKPYGISDGSNPFFDGRAFPKFNLQKGGVHSGHVQMGLRDPFCLVQNGKGKCKDGYTMEVTGPEGVRVLVATKAKPNQNFNSKLDREFFVSFLHIETRNNKLEMQSLNNQTLIEELDKLLERLRIPSEYAACLTGGSFDEAHMLQNVEACEWLAGALRALQVPNLDPAYADMRAVKEKRGELEILKATFVRRASEFLRNYFASLVDFMITDKSYFSQRGQLKRPDHADLRYKCRTYARLLQHLKNLDKSCLGQLRKAYCHSLNLLLRREAREFANELRASTKASRNPTVWLEASAASNQTVNNADTSMVSDAYSKMLTIFIPLLVDESSFFAHFMCFEVPALVPPGGPSSGNKNGTNDDDTNDDDLGIMDIDENDSKTSNGSSELGTLNESLQDLLDGIQEDFYAVVDWAYKIDPLRCISMHGITERYLSGQKADAAGFVRLLLDDLESRISMQFSRFVDEACHQIERNERNVRQMGVLSYIPRFATLATRMEQYIQGQSRELVDQAYMKFVSIMFVTLEKIAQAEPKYADIVLLENYAAFQNSLYDLANVVPTLAKFYHQASESYEQACTRHINMIIFYQFERLFQFARKIEDLMYTITPEEIPFQLGLSKMDLRKMLKSSLSGVDKSISAMYRRLQKNLTSEELLPSLWDKCKKEFLDKYESFAQLVAKIYPSETIPSVAEMRDLLASM